MFQVSDLGVIISCSDAEYVPVKKRRALEEQKRLQRLGRVRFHLAQTMRLIGTMVIRLSLNLDAGKVIAA